MKAGKERNHGWSAGPGPLCEEPRDVPSVR